MSEKKQELQDFTIKGELIGTINLTDTFKKVKEITQHKEAPKFLFIDCFQNIISHWDLDRVEEKGFPILVIKPFRKHDNNKIFEE